MPRDDTGNDRERSAEKIPNSERLVQLGQAVDRRSSGAPTRRVRSRRRKWVQRTVIALGLVVVLIVGAVVGDYYYLGSLIHHKNVTGLQNPGATENILMIGSTTRCGLKVQNIAYGLCSQGVTGVNSDIDMILHLDPSTGTVSLLSIPRDLFVPNARIEGANKIDAALYQGPSQLVAAIEEDFAIPINHYVELNFDTFASVVNALGGVYMDFPIPIFDQYSGLNIERPGCYLLDGVKALELVRARHLQIQPTPSNHDPRSWPQEALSDLARIRRTHEFLRVLAAKVAARGLGNPITDQSIATAVLPDLTVDNGFSEGSMVDLAETFAHTNIANVLQYTFPVLEVETGTYLYQGYYYGDIEFPVQPTGVNSVNQILGVAAGTNSFTDQPLPAPSSFPISIENGTGVASQAATVARGLTALGFKIKSTGDVTPVGPVSDTVVWYGGPKPPTSGNWISPAQAAAQAVLAQLQGPAILGYDPKNVTPGALVTVQTGTDLSVKAKAVATKKPPTKTTSTISAVTTTTIYDPPGVKTNSQFSAPSPVSAALAPWDPRACNAANTGPAVAATTTTTKAK
jgi:LCP family protein required for cell wall assembly